MFVSKQEILAALATIEVHAPAYFGDMPVSDDVARDIFATAMAALNQGSVKIEPKNIANPLILNTSGSRS